MAKDQDSRERKRSGRPPMTELEMRQKMMRLNVAVILVVGIVVSSALAFFVYETYYKDNDEDEGAYVPSYRTYATIHVSGSVTGDIRLELNEDKAPSSCENFEALAKNKYYEGTYWHRVIPGFMVQGGDPNTKDSDINNDGQGGAAYRYFSGYGTQSSPSSWTIPDESNNGLKNVRGAVAMAHTGNAKDFGGSQFYICVADASHLDGDYNVFAHVVSGMDVVDQIVNLSRNSDDNPYNHCYIDYVMIEQVMS